MGNALEIAIAIVALYAVCLPLTWWLLGESAISDPPLKERLSFTIRTLAMILAPVGLAGIVLYHLVLFCIAGYLHFKYRP